MNACWPERIRSRGVCPHCHEPFESISPNAKTCARASCKRAQQRLRMKRLKARAARAKGAKV